MVEHTAENGLLTEAERNALDDSLMDSGCHGFQGDHPDLYAAVERIVTARLSEAWDAGWLCRDVGSNRNPYRVFPPGNGDGGAS